ncbi:unnamed protein product [Rhizoctonia solani]|uniref:WD40 repeat-like protein n=1 Tax=Rhizoctonia solani TaxID=456999 RepID=A0A8H2WRB9_9AGAM|nr:unnamed protein product [Rhizoctonia solani]CAE6495445.1 unnamed protein product [Rhizoctonia solani]
MAKQRLSFTITPDRPMSSPISLPQVTVQTDALTAIGDVEQGIIENETIWVSCYDSSKPSVHGKVAVTISEGDRTQCAFKGREGVECKRVNNTIFHISCPALHINNRAVHFPKHTLTLPELISTKASSKFDRGINSLDVSTDGQIWAAGLGNGSVLVGASPLATKKDATHLEGNFHKASVSTVRFVNSSAVPESRVLSGSEDFSLALAELPTLPPPTSNGSNTSVTQALPPPSIRLTSHTRSVTSAQPLPCGKKAVSAGRDGTLRIWDLTPDFTSISRQIGMVRSTGDVVINSLALSSTPDSTTLAVLALQSGHFDLVDVETRSTLFSSSAPGFHFTKHGSLDAIDICPLPASPHKYILVTGSQRGVLSFYICAVGNTGVVTTSLGSCVRNGAGISDVKFISFPNASTDEYPRVLVATNDGLSYQLQISQTSGLSSLEFEVTAEYAGGADCSPVRAIARHAESDTVWIAGDDGVIWIY